MERILLGKQMKQVDNYTITQIGIPSMVLMEQAAMGDANQIENKYKDGNKILIVCGVGNNGADGLAVYRILMAKGYRAECIIVGNINNSTTEFVEQKKILKNCSYKYSMLESKFDYSNIEFKGYDIMIDGIFGVRLSRDVEGVYEDIINSINSCKIENNKINIISIDAPSGVNTDNGQIYNVAIKADYTITFGKIKLGLVMYPGASYGGNIIIHDIGIPWPVYGDRKSVV